jgi:predicted nucleic acid-binding protein
MIWLDSSYIVARLLGEPRAAFDVPAGPVFVLPAQLAECHVYFKKADISTTAVTATLEALPIHHSTFGESVTASRLYLDARREHSKASLADALLAAAVHAKNGSLLTFDDDF